MKNCTFLNILILITSILCLIKSSWSANILYIAGTASPSHTIWDKTLAIALRDKGHVITFVSHSQEKNSENFSTILLEGIYEKFASEIDFESSANGTTIKNVQLIFEWVYEACKHDLHTQGFETLLKQAKDGVKYDLIIMDVTSGIYFNHLVELFGYPPTVATSVTSIPPYLADAFSIEHYSSYVPHFVLQISPPMSFFERLFNHFIVMYELAVKTHYWSKVQNYMMELYGRDMSHIMDIERNYSILLANYDPIFDYPRPLPPYVIPVGGLHTQRNNKALPDDLQKYLDNSKQGVIIFSLGTNLRSDKLKEDKKQILLETFSKLKQNIIWKFESDIENLPKNVIVRKFLPQNDILAHPNVKLVINHGGALSTQEALYHGVPLVQIPFFLDQHATAFNTVYKKLGLKLNYEALTVDYMLSTLTEVLNNPIYKHNAQLVSKQYRDQQNNPLDRAIFWVEHVLRNGGAEHLRTGARDMPFYQTHLLDVWLFAAGVIIAVYLITRRLVCRKCLQSDVSNSNKKKSKRD